MARRAIRARTESDGSTRRGNKRPVTAGKMRANMGPPAEPTKGADLSKNLPYGGAERQQSPCGHRTPTWLKLGKTYLPSAGLMAFKEAWARRCGRGCRPDPAGPPWRCFCATHA